MVEKFPRLRRMMPDFLLNAVKNIWPDWDERLLKQQRLAKAWYRNTLGMMLRLTLQIAAVYLLCIVQLIFAKGFWEVYISTPMGQSFVRFSSHTTAIVSRAAALDIYDLALTATITSLFYIIIICAPAKFVGAKRFLYDGQGFLIKLAWFALGCLLAAKKISVNYAIDINIARLICIVPVATLFGTTFTFVSQIVPEFNIVGMFNYASKKRIEVRMRNNLNR